MQWDFIVRGYAGNKHPSAKLGECLGETSHKGVSSAQIEVQVWLVRCKRGDALYCQLIDCRPGHKEPTLRNIDLLTTIDWKEIYSNG